MSRRGLCDEEETPSRRRRALFEEDTPEAPEDEDSFHDLDYTGDGQVVAGSGVNINWLAAEFGISRRSVVNKLVGIRPMRYGQRHSPIYRVPEAAARLVKPDINVEEAMKRMRPQDLPPMTQAVFWDGMTKKTKWMREAGLLWHTDDVLEVLGDVFKTLRATIQLWADTVDKAETLSKEQMTFLRQQADALQSELYEKLVANARKTQTRPLSETPIDGLVLPEEDEGSEDVRDA